MNIEQHASNSLNFMRAAAQADTLVEAEAEQLIDQCARRAFKRQLRQSKLSHFDWFYLLTTLLALQDHAPANAAPPQAACGASAPG